MASAFDCTLPWESRTSLGEPVEPEVLSSSASSGWRLWALAGRRSASVQVPSGPGAATTSGS